jgi:hypothetical protein
MKAIAQNKLTKKLLLLLTLAGALIYLRTPPQAQATNCCLEEYQACLAGCHGNKACDNQCFTYFQECEQHGCIPSQ